MFGPDLSPNCIILIINGTARVNLGLEYDQYYSTTGSVYRTSTIVLLVQYIISTPAVVALAAMPYLRALEYSFSRVRNRPTNQVLIAICYNFLT